MVVIGCDKKKKSATKFEHKGVSGNQKVGVTIFYKFVKIPKTIDSLIDIFDKISDRL